MKAAPFSFHRCVFYLSSLSLISQWILQTRTFISSHVVMVVIVLGAPSGKRGDWQWDQIVFSFFASKNGRTTVTECFVFTCLTYRNVQRFRNRSVHELYGLKAVKWAKFLLVLTIPTCWKIKNLWEQNGSTVAHNSHGKRINLTAKRITSRQKE